MSGWERLKNLWRLSEFEPNTSKDFQLPVGTTVIQSLVKKPQQNAIFLPYEPVSPVQKIINSI